MSHIPIGLQLFSVRESLAKDFRGTLERVHDIGYRNVEFAFHNTGADGRFEVAYTAAELKRIMSSVGLKVVTSHVSYHPNLDWDAVIRYNAELGSEGVVMPAAFFTSKQDALDLAAWLNRSGRKCKAEGMEFYFHNHYHEFETFEGETVMDMLLAHTDPELVKIELDTYWALRGGVDPLEFMDRHASRIGLLHQKDLSAAATPVNLLEKVSGPLTPEAVFGAVERGDFAEIGNGVMDIAAILDKAKTLSAVKYIIVEQDQTSKGELESVKESYDNICKLIG